MLTYKVAVVRREQGVRNVSKVSDDELQSRLDSLKAAT